MIIFLRVIVLTMMSVAAVGHAQAESVRRGGGNTDGAALAKFQQMVSEVTAERDVLQSENAKQKDEIAALKKRLEDLTKKNDAIKERVGDSSEALAKFQANNQALIERIQRDRERTQELISKFRETVQALREVEAEKGVLHAGFEDKDKQLGVCAARNLALYEMNKDLIAQYESKGVWAALLQREPVTQLKRAQIEAMVEDYRTKNDKAQYVSTQP